MSNKNPELNKNIFPIFTLMISVSFLVVVIGTCIFFKLRLDRVSEDKSEVITVTEYIYINKEDDSSISAGKDDVEEESFIVKEHLGQIGIFSLCGGEIRYVIERYIKTLPEADKRLLEEGFVVIGMNGIYSVIEDYTG